MKDRILMPATVITLVLLVVFSLICITRQTDQLKVLYKAIQELEEGKKLKIEKKITGIENAIKETRDHLTTAEGYIKKDKVNRCADVKIKIEEIMKQLRQMRVDINKNASFYKKKR